MSTCLPTSDSTWRRPWLWADAQFRLGEVMPPLPQGQGSISSYPGYQVPYLDEVTAFRGSILRNAFAKMNSFEITEGIEWLPQQGRASVSPRRRRAICMSEARGPLFLTGFSPGTKAARYCSGSRIRTSGETARSWWMESSTT